MAELQGAAEAAERALWAKLGYRQDDLVDAATPFAELARALPAGRRAGRIHRGRRATTRRASSTPATPQAAEDLYAFVLRAHAAPRLLRIGRIDALTAQTRAWYGGLRDPQSDPTQLRERGEDLRRDLFGQIDGLAGKQTLFVIPFGDLFRISFAALPEPGSDRYWIESGMRVHTLSHESELLMPASAAACGQGPAGRCAGVRCAVGTRHKWKMWQRRRFARSFAHASPSMALRRFPVRRANSMALRDVLHDALGTNGRFNCIDGAQATKEHVLAALDGADVVHIATHGFSFDESCGGDDARGMTLDRATGWQRRRSHSRCRAWRLPAPMSAADTRRSACSAPAR